MAGSTRTTKPAKVAAPSNEELAQGLVMLAKGLGELKELVASQPEAKSPKANGRSKSRKSEGISEKLAEDITAYGERATSPERVAYKTAVSTAYLEARQSGSTHDEAIEMAEAVKVPSDIPDSAAERYVGRLSWFANRS